LVNFNDFIVISVWNWTINASIANSLVFPSNRLCCCKAKQRHQHENQDQRRFRIKIVLFKKHHEQHLFTFNDFAE